MLYIRYNGVRAKTSIVFLIITIGLNIIYRAFLVWQNIQWRQISPDSFLRGRFSTIYPMQLVIIYSMSIVSILTIIYFIRWFRRAYYNLHQIPGAPVSYSEGWAAGCWFVPFLNLVRPYKIMKEVWNGTQNVITHRLVKVEPSSFVGIWWAVYLFSCFFSYFVAILSRNVSGLDGLEASLYLNLLNGLISMFAAFLGIQLIKKIQVFENELWQEAQTPSDSVFSLVPENQQQV